MTKGSDLDRLFEERASRLAVERGVQQQRRVEHQEFRARSAQIIQEVVGPVLEGVKADLIRRGHKATLSLHLENFSFPSAHLAVQLTDNLIKTEPSGESKISFSTTSEEDRSEVRKDVWTRDRPRFEQTLPKPSTPLEQITMDWVRSEALIFLRSLLRNT